MAIELGFRLEHVTVTLAQGGNFVAGLERDDGQPWGDGVAVELQFPLDEGAPAVVWPATVTGARASWNVPAAQVDELMSSLPRPVRLRYTGADGTPMVWGKGTTRAD